MHRLSFCCVIIVILPALASAQTAEEKKATIAYLRGLQQKDGGFLAAPASPSGAKPISALRSTSAGIRAIGYWGGEVPDKDAARKYVAKLFDKKTGGFIPSALDDVKPDVYNTAVGLMAVVELKIPLEDVEKPAIQFLGENAKNFEEIRIAVAGLEAVGKLPPQGKDWLAQLEKMKNADGTWGKGPGAARDTGGTAVAILRLGGKLSDRDNILKTMRTGQRKDGGFGQASSETSDLETTYRVMRCFMMLKEKPDDPAKVRAFIASCRAKDGGYGVAPGAPSNVGGTYFAGIVLKWLEEK
jgi:prenyltransferase beta subunit